MEPEDIEGREFFVGLRGYDRDEVNQFLAELAAEHRALLDELQGNAPVARDPFEDLGANVTAILRTANESATTITAEAEATATELREQAEQYAERVRQKADEDALRILYDAEDELGRRRTELDAEAERLQNAASETDAESERILEEARHHAREILERAHEEAGRLLNEADGRAATIEADAEERGRERARVRVEEAVFRLADATRRHEDLRARLAETSDEIQLVLMALGEPIADPRQAIDDAVRELVVLDGTEPVGHDG
jgi:DivIVA domain-containing protein